MSFSSGIKLAYSKISIDIYLSGRPFDPDGINHSCIGKTKFRIEAVLTVIARLRDDFLNLPNFISIDGRFEFGKFIKFILNGVL